MHTLVFAFSTLSQVMHGAPMVLCKQLSLAFLPSGLNYCFFNGLNDDMTDNTCNCIGCFKACPRGIRFFILLPQESSVASCRHFRSQRWVIIHYISHDWCWCSSRRSMVHDPFRCCWSSRRSLQHGCWRICFGFNSKRHRAYCESRICIKRKLKLARNQA